MKGNGKLGNKKRDPIKSNTLNISSFNFVLSYKRQNIVEKNMVGNIYNLYT